jgi:hypothetical protein
MLWTSFIAPSAVCSKEMPSRALDEARLRPRIWPRNFSEIASPAASSAARLMRRPELKRSRVRARTLPVVLRLRAEFNATTLLLMRKIDIYKILLDFVSYVRNAQLGGAR